MFNAFHRLKVLKINGSTIYTSSFKTTFMKHLIYYILSRLQLKIIFSKIASIAL